MKILFHWTIAELIYLSLASYRMTNFIRKVSASNQANTQENALSFACIRMCAGDDACAATNVLLEQLSCTYLNRTQLESTITFDEIIYVKIESGDVQSSVSTLSTQTPTTVAVHTTATTTITTTTTTTTVTTTTAGTTTSTTTTTTPAFTTCQNGGSWSDAFQTTCTCVPSFAGTFCERHWDDCAEGFKLGVTLNGVYTIHPRNYPNSFTVYCVMKFGGRTSIQRQATGITFRQTWAKYRDGFGVISGDHWLGLAKIKAISDLYPCSLIIHMKYASQPNWKQVFLHFLNLTGEADGYRLYYTYRSNPINTNNALPRAMNTLNGSMFSTYDHDNDASTTNCAETHGSGWWFKDCTPCNPNGQLRPIKNTFSGNPREIFWTGETRGTKQTYMALRRQN